MELEQRQGKMCKGLKAQELNKLLREAYRNVIPEIANRIARALEEPTCSLLSLLASELVGFDV